MCMFNNKGFLLVESILLFQVVIILSSLMIALFTSTIQFRQNKQVSIPNEFEIKEIYQEVKTNEITE